MSNATLQRGAHVPASPDAAALVRSAVAELLAENGWPADDSADIVLATSEAVTNAIEHGSEPGGDLWIAARMEDGALDLRIRDEGRPDRSRPLPPMEGPPPPDAATRGRGLIIMRSLAETLDVIPVSGGGTEVRLVFCRTPAAERVHAALPAAA